MPHHEGGLQEQAEADANLVRDRAMKVVLKIAYDGRAFYGFQRQSQEKTVQGSLEAALARILQHSVTIQGAGRTDQGVHASGQVVAFSSDSTPDMRRLCHSLNGMLPDGVSIVEAAALPSDDPFHPRYSAISRTYSYYLMDGCGPREARLWSDRVWCLPRQLDLDAANAAADLFLGEHDFSTFSYKETQKHTRSRRVDEIRLTAQPAPALLCPEAGARLLRLTITANGFLRRMVRLITAGVMEVGTGQRELEDLRLRFAACDPGQAPLAAPPDGLYLEHIAYQPDPFESTKGSHRHAFAKLRSQHRVKISTVSPRSPS